MKKKATKKVVKKKTISSELTGAMSTGYAQPAEGDSYPYKAEISENFYTEKNTISADDRKKLVALIQKPEYRIFEKYIDWRVSASAHKMKANLIEGKPDKAAIEAAEIDALVKVGQDMANFWEEVKLMEKKQEFMLKEDTKKNFKAFGDDRYFLHSNETI